MLSQSNTSRITWSFEKESGNEPLPWGPHGISTLLDLEGVEVSLVAADTGSLYRRGGINGKVEKLVFSKKESFFLTPVEPVHLPGKLGNHLLIDFKHHLHLEPLAKRTVYVTFPVEIAVSIGQRPSAESVIDVFALGKPKYTLYGSVRNGLICKYWQSELFDKVPFCNPLTEGVMRIDLQNTSSLWVEISKAVFSAQGMKIYYGSKMVCMNAVMKILNERDAETSFIDQPLEKGLRLAPEHFSSRFLTQQGKMLMEEGY